MGLDRVITGLELVGVVLLCVAVGFGVAGAAGGPYRVAAGVAATGAALLAVGVALDVWRGTGPRP